jgi:hypothetical protein
MSDNHGIQLVHGMIWCCVWYWFPSQSSTQKNERKRTYKSMLKGASTRTIPHPIRCPICMQIGGPSDSLSDFLSDTNQPLSYVYTKLLTKLIFRNAPNFGKHILTVQAIGRATGNGMEKQNCLFRCSISCWTEKHLIFAAYALNKPEVVTVPKRKFSHSGESHASQISERTGPWGDSP